MFFTVKHGADEQVLFNPDCSLKLLLDSIKKRCNFPSGAVVALADEKCVIINLGEQNDFMPCCSTLFTDRGIYTLLAIYKRDSGPPMYKPLLDSVDPDLAIKLESLSNPRAAADTRTAHLKKQMRSKISLPTSRSKRSSSSAAGKHGRGK